MIDVNQLNKASSLFVGNKAANFGILNQISKTANFKVPEMGFAIPFYYYDLHMKQSKVKEKIEQLAANKELLKSPELLKKALEDIRDSILHFPVDKNLVEKIQLKLMSNPNYTLFRFRSSTNAEDANGFSGAGLYDSKTVDLNSKKKRLKMR